MFDSDSKTEKPTPRRREKARSEGGVAKSMELNSAIVLTSAALMLMWFGASMFEGLKTVLIVSLKNMATFNISTESMPTYIKGGFRAVAGILFPMFAGVMIAGVAANIGQFGFRVTAKSAYPKFSRLNPLKGIKRFFSVRSIVEIAKSVLKLVLIGGIIYLTVMASMPEIRSLTDVPFDSIATVMGRILVHVFFIAAISLLILGVLDYAYQKYEFEKSLRMTKEEIREESKQSDGDQKVKGKVREIMIRNSLRRMMKKVPEADVVITNPIHLAVAIKYDRSKRSAPIVVAKGARKVAERIKALAAEHDIPIVENKPLARALFKVVEIGQEIPVELYKAVAEVLAYVYRLKKKYFGVA